MASDPKLTRICVQKVTPPKAAATASSNVFRAAFWKTKLWPEGSTIRIGFLDKPSSANSRTSISKLKEVGRLLDPLQEELKDTPIKEAIKTIVLKRIQPIVGLKLVFVPDANAKSADVRISFADPAAAWSLVGTDAKDASKKDKNPATMNLGWFDVGTVIHEFGHVLGMIHEHQNPRGEQIDWNIPKVDEFMESTQGWDAKQVQHNVLDHYSVDQINGSDFDPQSVMLYFFPASLTLNHQGTKQNFRLSGEDVTWISKTYPGGKMSPAEFYQWAYGESIEKSIQVSKSEATSSQKFKTWEVLLALVAVVLIGILIFWVIKKHWK